MVCEVMDVSFSSLLLFEVLHCLKTSLALRAIIYMKAIQEGARCFVISRDKLARRCLHKLFKRI